MAQQQDHVEGISSPLMWKSVAGPALKLLPPPVFHLGAGPALKLLARPVWKLRAAPVLTSTRDDDTQLDYALNKAYEEFLEQIVIAGESHDSAPRIHLPSPVCLSGVDYGSILNSIKPPQDERAPPSSAFTEELLQANLCSLKGKAVESPPTGSDDFKLTAGFFGRGPDSIFGPHHPQNDIGGMTALPGFVGVDLELGYPLVDIGGIRAHLLPAEGHAYHNQELIAYKQWEAYMKGLKIVNSGAGDSMLIQPVITLLGEAFGGALAHALSSSEEPSQIKSLVQASILIGVGLTVAGIGLRRFKRRLSHNVMKAGAMATALAIIVAFAGLLPPFLAWSVGAVASILVATGLAMI